MKERSSVKWRGKGVEGGGVAGSVRSDTVGNLHFQQEHVNLKITLQFRI